jgi:hypothetical protein
MENKHDLRNKHEHNITYMERVTARRIKRGRVIEKRLVPTYAINVLWSKPHILKGVTLHEDVPYNGLI